MNKRLQKKADKRRRQEIHKVLDLVLDINGLGERKQTLTGNLPTAFLSFYGHTAEINVQIDREGWRYGKTRPDFYVYAYTDREKGVRTMIDALEKEKDPGDGHPQRSNT